MEALKFIEDSIRENDERELPVDAAWLDEISNVSGDCLNGKLRRFKSCKATLEASSSQFVPMRYVFESPVVSVGFPLGVVPTRGDVLDLLRMTGGGE